MTKNGKELNFTNFFWNKCLSPEDMVQNVSPTEKSLFVSTKN